MVWRKILYQQQSLHKRLCIKYKLHRMDFIWIAGIIDEFSIVDGTKHKAFDALKADTKGFDISVNDMLAMCLMIKTQQSLALSQGIVQLVQEKLPLRWQDTHSKCQYTSKNHATNAKVNRNDAYVNLVIVSSLEVDDFMIEFI